MRLTDGSGRARLTLAVDLLALLAFIVVGTWSHEPADFVAAALRDVVAFGASWIVATLVFGTYRPPTSPALAKTVVTAIVLGAVVRAIWVGSTTESRLVGFIAIALVFVSLFIGTGRVLLSLALDRVGRHA